MPPALPYMWNRYSPKVVVLVVEPLVTVLTTASVLMADELRDELWVIVIVELYEM